MGKLNARLAGVELYFDDLARAKRFYENTLGLTIIDEQTGHHAQLFGGSAFICLEKRGVEDYPSRDKAVLFFEVANLRGAIEAIGRDRFVRYVPQNEKQAGWAVLHDPEGHNVLLLERPASK